MNLDALIRSRSIVVSIILTLLSFFVFALYWVLLKDSIEQNIQLVKSFSEAKNQLKTSDSSAQLSRQLNAGELAIKSLGQKLYLQSEGRDSNVIVPFVVSALDAISYKYNVKLRGVIPLEAKQVLMLEEMPFDITISGSYTQIYEWLIEAEQALNPMAVKNFSINPSNREHGVTMKMRVVSYRLPLGKG